MELKLNRVVVDVAEIKGRLGVLERSVGSIEKNNSIMRDDIAELKAGQIETRDLLARVAVCVDHTAPDQT
ncbi:hypothetical protein ACFHYQ_14780 [Sphaerimonospora cavernae]|uniref:Uncharacterized protein n=1 Tax=Sphaerimonospora cavernae TaxID=1740611 RepID=A0ABV6U6A7_9ACTN